MDKKFQSHIEKPGTGVLFWEKPEDRRSESHPDFKGFVLLEMDYKAGEKLKIALWEKQTSQGTTLFSVKEDNYTKKRDLENNAPKEVKPAYFKKYGQAPKSDITDDDIPF